MIAIKQSAGVIRAARHYQAAEAAVELIGILGKSSTALSEIRIQVCGRPVFLTALSSAPSAFIVESLRQVLMKYVDLQVLEANEHLQFAVTGDHNDLPENKNKIFIQHP